jgi:hypothetical protein
MLVADCFCVFIRAIAASFFFDLRPPREICAMFFGSLLIS